ncbi:hypothetical protein, partial [Escherichia coli]|uniref:hypothetical protein n=1 Tax=Escherichia coli TaxID=562 RepID=UPI0030F41DCC
TDFGGKTSIFSHPVYLFLRKFSLQDFRGGSMFYKEMGWDPQLGCPTRETLQRLGLEDIAADLAAHNLLPA